MPQEGIRNYNRNRSCGLSNSRSLTGSAQNVILHRHPRVTGGKTEASGEEALARGLTTSSRERALVTGS